MYNRNNGIASYGKVANTETDPIKQIVMLYDGAIRFLTVSAADIENADFTAKAYNSNRALDIINYLQSILDLENGGDVGRSLDDLYARVKVMIFKASARLDAALMRKAADALRPVRDAWETNANARSFVTPGPAANPTFATAA